MPVKLSIISDMHGQLPDINSCDLLLICGDICPVYDHSISLVIRRINKMSNHLKQTLVFATKAHAGQFRKDGVTPYILHPVAVALAAGKHGLPLEVQQAALLHDVLEHKVTTVEELKQTFGTYITELVQEVTNPSEVVAAIKSKTRTERKLCDREHLSKASKYGKALKLLDIQDNLSDMPYGDSKEFQEKYLAEKRLEYQILADADWRIANDVMAEFIRVESLLRKN